MTPKKWFILLSAITITGLIVAGYRSVRKSISEFIDDVFDDSNWWGMA